MSLPGVEAATKYDGSPVLKVGGAFMAGVATHPSAEPETLVVRSGFEERALLLEEAPDTYYVTDHYRKHPVVLVRLSRLDTDALRDLLSVSWRLTMRRGGHVQKKPADEPRCTRVVRATRARTRAGSTRNTRN